MIKVNDNIIDVNKFPDGTLLLKENCSLPMSGSIIRWHFENNEELVALIYLTKHLRSRGAKRIYLEMPYIPNSRMDRVKNPDDVFTLKYFTDIINYLQFDDVTVLDPHSFVSTALINNVSQADPKFYIDWAIESCTPDMLFFPDEGSVKRLADMFQSAYAFGIKKRNWETGKIEGLDVAGCVDKIKDSNILIVDDICSRGGTFYHSAKKLKELGAKNIYLYVTHCENTILEGDLLTSGLVEKVYTTNSIFTKEHDMIEVFEL